MACPDPTTFRAPIRQSAVTSFHACPVAKLGHAASRLRAWARTCCPASSSAAGSTVAAPRCTPARRTAALDVAAVALCTTFSAPPLPAVERAASRGRLPVAVETFCGTPRPVEDKPSSPGGARSVETSPLNVAALAETPLLLPSPFLRRARMLHPTRFAATRSLSISSSLDLMSCFALRSAACSLLFSASSSGHPRASGAVVVAPRTPSPNLPSTA